MSSTSRYCFLWINTQQWNWIKWKNLSSVVRSPHPGSTKLIRTHLPISNVGGAPSLHIPAIFFIVSILIHTRGFSVHFSNHKWWWTFFFLHTSLVSCMPRSETKISNPVPCSFLNWFICFLTVLSSLHVETAIMEWKIYAAPSGENWEYKINKDIFLPSEDPVSRRGCI